MTDCQRRYQEATLPSFQGNFVPQCKLDGQYEAVQCQGSNGECWCVDQDGKEISGTRTTQALKCPVSGRVKNTNAKTQLRYDCKFNDVLPIFRIIFPRRSRCRLHRFLFLSLL